MSVVVKTEDREIRPRMTFDEFLAWLPEDGRAEWVDGEVVSISPVNWEHQDIVGFLAATMRGYAEVKKAGHVSTGPYLMRLNEVDRGREPDVVFVGSSNLSRVGDTFLDGPADLAVEVVSPDSLIRDRGEKYAEYEAEGVREYWVIDPHTKRADFFVLDDQGRYNRAAVEPDGTYRSVVLAGYWLNVNWLWRRPMPGVFDTLKLLMDS